MKEIFKLGRLIPKVEKPARQIEMEMFLTESIDPLGKPTLILRDRDGNIVNEICSSNLVVNSGRNGLLRLLTGDYTQKITKIELGSGGVAGGDPFVALPVSAADTALASPFAPVIEKTISGYSYDAGTFPTQGHFSVIFDSAEVDKIVSEAALKFADGRLYARYTFPSVYLKSDKGYSLEIIWSVNFS